MVNHRNSYDIGYMLEYTAMYVKNGFLGKLCYKKTVKHLIVYNHENHMEKHL